MSQATLSLTRYGNVGHPCLGLCLGQVIFQDPSTMWAGEGGAGREREGSGREASLAVALRAGSMGGRT